MAYKMIKKNGECEVEGTGHKEFMVDKASDLNSIDLTEVAPGSFAYTADLSQLWQLKINKTWAVIGGS